MDSATRGSRRVFFAFSDPSPVQTTIRSPSRPTHTGTLCGEPSDISVARWAKFGRSTSCLISVLSAWAMAGASCRRGSGIDGNGQVEERRVLLGAEHVALAGAAARAVPADGELDGQGGLVLDEGGDSLARDSEEPGHRLGGER